MRNTTKLKHILSRYSVTLDLTDDGRFTLILMDKSFDGGTDIYGGSYSEVLRKAYSYYKKKIKEEQSLSS